MDRQIDPERLPHCTTHSTHIPITDQPVHDHYVVVMKIPNGNVAHRITNRVKLNLFEAEGKKMSLTE